MDKKSEIYRCGKELFSEHGFKDTSVSDITKKAGIAAGTFYLYYPSKEDLFMDIYLDENVKLKKQIHAAMNFDADPMTVIREVTEKNFIGMMSNPILRQWYNRDVFSKIEQKYRENNGLDKVDFLYDFYFELIQKWQAEGKMRSDININMIMAIFGAIINIDTHKEEIGLEFFPEIMDYMLEFVMKGLEVQPVSPESHENE